MAQQNTGLGWSAKDNWLIQGDGATIATLKKFGGSQFPGQPIPQAETGYDVQNNGVTLGHDADSTYYLAACYGVEALLFFVAPNKFYVVTEAATTNAYCYTTLLPNQRLFPDPPRKANTTYYSQYGLAYGLHTISIGGTFVINPSIPVFSSEAEGMAAIEIVTIPFTKTNAGYSVACVAKWKTPNGTKLESPILISSNSEFVDMDTTATGTSIAKLNMLYNGMRFYMSFYDMPYSGALQASVNEIDKSGDSDPTFSLEELFKYIANTTNANILVTNAPDPYQEGDGSGEGGGDGEEDDADNVDFTDPPSTTITASGFLTIFCPNLGQLQNLANFMWTTFDIDNWRRLFANPMDAILGLHVIPIPPVITGNKSVKVAGISTEIMMDYTSVRYVRRSMGTCEIPKKWGAYLDYNPYTKVSIFLPYIGFKELDADDVMGETLSLQYMVDVLTGACVAELKSKDTVLYAWQGNCANEVPITGSDWRSAITSALSLVATVATTVATGGASAPMIAGTVASVGANSMNLKPNINRSGSISGSSGFMGNQRPYIIRTIPNLVIPTDQNKFIGYPSFVTTSLGSLTGYNEISSIHLEGIPATGNELTEIETLLKGGVIF